MGPAPIAVPPAEASAPRWPEPGMLVRNPVSGLGYHLGRVLGEGAFGVTFDCTSEFDEPLVAKYLKPIRTKEETEVDWRKEVQTLSLLRHPNVIHVFDGFEAGGVYYVIMERAWGSLRHLVGQHGPYPHATVVEIGRQLLSALNFVHAQRVIHRDLHIDNILWLGTMPAPLMKISDFGISKSLGQGEGPYAFTNVGRSMDVAPELVRGGYTTVQSDLYQLGLVLYFCLTGYLAVGPQDGDPAAVITSGMAQARARVLPDKIGAVLARLLETDERLRYSNALEAWYALRAAAV